MMEGDKVILSDEYLKILDSQGHHEEPGIRYTIIRIHVWPAGKSCFVIRNKTKEHLVYRQWIVPTQHKPCREWRQWKKEYDSQWNRED